MAYEYKLIIEDQTDSRTEQAFSRILSEHGAEGWRVVQMNTSASYGEKGLAHDSDVGYQHRIVFLLERSSDAAEEGVA
jgi:hypothetical protein